ncbi:MAG: hypothetical protein VB858_14290, partial [Planctomycetaceae bacterium]
MTRQLQNPRTESLEDRTLLTTTVYLDFGAAFPMGGIATTVDGFKNIDGPGFANLGTGADLTGNTGLIASDPLTFEPLQYDFNGDLTIDAQDAIDLGDAVLNIARVTVDPLDIDVQLASVT